MTSQLKNDDEVAAAATTAENKTTTDTKYPLSTHPNDGKSQYGGRDTVGYGSKPPNPKWPNDAKLALNFVLNYEEGGENCLLHGDSESEKLLSEIVGAGAYGEFEQDQLVAMYLEISFEQLIKHIPFQKNAEQQRHANMESLYDYGSRAGFWRLHNLLTRKEIPCTVFAVGMALQRNPEVCEAMKQTSNWEVASHGYRWWDYQNVNEDVEREHIQRTVEIHKEMIGTRPVVS